MPLPLEDYGLIGDCETAALIGRDGSLDWLCWPRFDSPACFAALLGTPEHGCWRIAPTAPQTRTTRRYRPGTLILETMFETDEGSVTLADFMPLRDEASNVVRLLIGTRGSVEVGIDLAIRFDYGSSVPWMTRIDEETLRGVAGPDMVVLRSRVPLHGEGLRTRAKVTLHAGERVAFTLTHSPSHKPVPPPIDPEEALAATEAYWTRWTSACRSADPYTEQVRRSLIILKALTYMPTGGIVAAPTTSLPEKIGGERNWDYRFCWLRDATLTLMALMDAGYFDEAAAWRDWLVRAVAGSPDQVQIMYGLAGERRLIEWEADWLPGYEGSAPVRIGNAAHSQRQLDIFGEVMDAMHQGRLGGLGPSDAGWNLQRALVHHVGQIWREPDEGIWETRGGRCQFTHSKVMAWVAVDRAIRSVERFGLEGPLRKWRQLSSAIRADVCANGYNRELGSFVRTYGGRELDASLLMLPTVGFLPADDPRIAGTIAAIERDLLVDGLVLRYRTEGVDDGLPPGEGAFLACSFWLADAYVMQGRMDEARTLFTHLQSLANDLGLLAEEYDPRGRRLIGNFPQAFSHLALVNTAHNLTRAAKPAQQRASEADASADRLGSAGGSD